MDQAPNLNFNVKAVRYLFSIEQPAAKSKFFAVFVCASLLTHCIFFFFLINSDILPFRRKNTEPIPVEIIEAASIMNLEKPPPNEIGSGDETSKAPFAANASKSETAVTKANQIKIGDEVKLKDQPERKNLEIDLDSTASKPENKVSASNEGEQASGSASNLQGSRDKPHVSGKRAAKFSKAVARIKTITSPKSNSQVDASTKTTAIRKEMPAFIGTPDRNQRGVIFDQNKVRSSLPNIPFDPQIVRAVAVPLPSPDGSEPVSYKEIVFGLLERAKHYPETALARGAKGSAVVAFSLDSAGNIINGLLIQSSGQPDLDAESLEILRRASPFPPPPFGAQRSFSAEIGFGVVKE